MVRRSTWIILGVFVLVLAAFLTFQEVSEDEPEETLAIDIEQLITQEPIKELLGIPPGDYVVGLRLVDSEGNVVEISRPTEEADWELIMPMGDADQETINRVIPQILSLEIQETLGESIELSLLGLEEPSYTMVLSISNQGFFTLYIGDVTITDTSYYVRLPGDPPVVVNKFSLDTIINWIADPPIQELPTSTPEL